MNQAGADESDDGRFQDFLSDLSTGEACLILKNGLPEDVQIIKSSIQERCLHIGREYEFVQSNGLTGLIISIPPQTVPDLILELVVKGISGELIGYEAGGVNEGISR